MSDNATTRHDLTGYCPKHGPQLIVEQLAYTGPARDGCRFAVTLACGCMVDGTVSAPQPGDRVRLTTITDDSTTLKPGALGTVTSIDGTGTVHVRWDDGRQLGLVPEAGDCFEVTGHV